jgi:hypothetical protein
VREPWDHLGDGNVVEDDGRFHSTFNRAPLTAPITFTPWERSV